jgi:hypothetical protein
VSAWQSHETMKPTLLIQFQCRSNNGQIRWNEEMSYYYWITITPSLLSDMEKKMTIAFYIDMNCIVRVYH